MDLFGFDPPEIDGATAAAITHRHWAITGEPRRVRGERSSNTVITTPSGERYVLQVQSASERPDVIDLQTSAMRHVERRDASIPIPHVVPTTAGESLATVDLGSTHHLARLVNYLPGVTFDESRPLRAAAYAAIGGLLGRIAAALDDFAHPAAGHFMPWDIGNGLIVDPGLRVGLDDEPARALAAVDERLHAAAALVGSLPRRTIHNDGHAANLIRADDRSEWVTGVIDFGDVVLTARAADVAIIAESFAPNADDPAGVLAAITAGYHAQLPLDDEEVEALPELVLARTALNVLMVEHQLRHAPHLRDHAAATRVGAMTRLARWHALDADAMIARIHTELETR